MSGSESKSEQETAGSSGSETGRPSLADFLAPPRSRSSAPPPAVATAANAETVATPALPAVQTEGPSAAQTEVAPAASESPSSEASLSAAEAPTPTEPTQVSDVPPAPVPVAASRTAEPRPSRAPLSSGDGGARSLIPVATSSASNAPNDDLDGDFQLPGAGPPWSSASIRRATFVALLAAAAAVPAWVVFRARAVDVQARSEASAPKPAAASAGPSTPSPAREIEADEEPSDTEPAAIAVPVDPVKGLAARREARRLLEAGQIEPGVAAARSAIALNPADPESYVLLAAGLQDMGRWAESREVFSRCIHKSNNTINAECIYFATSVTSTNR